MQFIRFWPGNISKVFVPSLQHQYRTFEIKKIKKETFTIQSCYAKLYNLLMNSFKEFAFKKLGYLEFNGDFNTQFKRQKTDIFIKIAYVRSGGIVKIDFEEFMLEKDAFFFINPGQFFEINKDCSGLMVYYNRDFYCIEIHDKEVACDGILFHNIYEIPVILLTPEDSLNLCSLMQQTATEILIGDYGTEEMLRIILKQLIIKCTRIWKKEHGMSTEHARPEIEFLRLFSQLIDTNYTRFHAVADYADLLNITAKALNKRISQYNRISPNNLIKNRIILEAKRLLAHTQLNVKEIGYKLGYNDSSYFIRFFTTHTAVSPHKFRLQYQQSYLGK